MKIIIKILSGIDLEKIPTFDTLYILWWRKLIVHSYEFKICIFFFSPISHPWETVAQAAWRKYPNPITTAVIGTDVVDRRVDDNGVLHTHRVVSSKWYFPKWAQAVSKYFKTNPNKYINNIFILRCSIITSWAVIIMILWYVLPIFYFIVFYFKIKFVLLCENMKWMKFFVWCVKSFLHIISRWIYAFFNKVSCPITITYFRNAHVIKSNWILLIRFFELLVGINVIHCLCLFLEQIHKFKS